MKPRNMDPLHPDLVPDYMYLFTGFSLVTCLRTFSDDHLHPVLPRGRSPGIPGKPFFRPQVFHPAQVIDLQVVGEYIRPVGGRVEHQAGWEGYALWLRSPKKAPGSCTPAK